MHPQHLFVVGSPRSGTTWLQLLLAQHAEVVTDKETQLFTQYVQRLQERWAEEMHEARVAMTNGLTRVLSEDEFYEAIKAFCDRVFEALAADDPDARFVLEKSPEHALHADTILRLYPDAWFLHIIRDPRAVSNSFSHAAKKWWTWAPSGPIETTRRWRKNVTVGRAIAERTGRYREVRYEDLKEQGPEALGAIFDWLGLESDAGFCREAIAACDIQRLKSGEAGSGKDQPWEVGKEPEGFFRAGRSDSWTTELSRGRIALIEHEAGPLLDELGYERRSRLRARAPARAIVHDTGAVLRRFGREMSHRVGWRVDRFLRRM